MFINILNNADIHNNNFMEDFNNNDGINNINLLYFNFQTENYIKSLNILNYILNVLIILIKYYFKHFFVYLL